MFHHSGNTTGNADVTLLLSTIKELETGSLNNTLNAGTIPVALHATSKMATAGSSAIPVDSSSVTIPSTPLPPADSSVVHETSAGSVPSRRRRFDIVRKESLSKSASLDSTPSPRTKEAVEKRKSDGGQSSAGSSSGAGDAKTGEVYV